MSWIIAILLGLILVALMCSNKAAAEGVWKVAKIALIGLALCVAAIVLAVWAVWVYEKYAPDGWLQTTYIVAFIAMFVIGGPLSLWSARKEIVSTYRNVEKRKLALKDNLRELSKEVVLRLAGKNEKAVRQLALPYGGGKTHTLITLYHLVNDSQKLPDLPAVREFKEVELGGE